MEIKNVTVAGAGVLGSQIAFQSAFKGFNVSVYDIDDAAIEKAKERIRILQKRYQEDNYGSKEEVDKAFGRLSFFTDLGEAVSDADLIIEAVPEVVKIKHEFYDKLSKVAPEKSIFASNSSTFVPSQLIDHIDRPERYLHLHFANEIWRLNIAEVMKHERTSQEVFDDVIEFAKAIAMVPIAIQKEQPGYVLNTLLVPFLTAAMQLVVDEVADPKTVDKTWMISSGAPIGPFAFLDIIGPNTPYNLYKAQGEAGNELAARAAEWLKKEYLDKGRMGTANGKGIYEYPNPEYRNPEFIKAEKTKEAQI